MLNLYSTGCLRCIYLKAAFDKTGIQYQEITDKEIFLEKGFIQYPIVEDEAGETYTYTEALRRFVFEKEE